MLKLVIETPIWRDGGAVGVAARRLVDGTMMDVTISYKDKAGNLVYPHIYRIACSKIRKYPTKTLREGVVLHVVPIRDFEVVT